jgi:Tfp pilus assembly protein PilO
MAKAGNILSTKRNLIDRANTTVVVMVSTAVFLMVFSLVATKTLVSQANYQGRVIAQKRKAVNMLKKDIEAAKKLKKSYTAFTSTSQNALGGNPLGLGQQDGNNAKIVLDALPSKYDFPELPTSLEALLASQGVKINMIDGRDEEIAQSSNKESSAPKSIVMPFEFTVAGDYDSIKNVVSAVERSIRPMQVISLDVSAEQKELTLAIKAQTYYQPATSLNIRKVVVK